MLGWIYIWKNYDGTNLHRVKIRFGNLWFYLSIYRPHSIIPLESSILSQGVFYKNKCSRQERWTGLEEPDYKDYCDLSIYELSRIIFIGAPENERKEREAEWEGLGSYYRRRLPMKIDLNVFHYPNRFYIRFPSLDHLTFDVWKKLSRRQNKKKPKNIVRWFNSAVDTGDPGNYFCTPLGNFEVNLIALIWWLGDKRAGVLLEKMFENL